MFSFFHKNKRYKDGHGCYCKECAKIVNKKYPINNELKQAARQRYRFKNQIFINTRQNELNQKRKFKRLIHRANSTSKKRSTGELITAWQLWCLAKKQKLKCAISGVKLTNENISLDHKIPFARGGKNTIENCQFITYDINRIKNSYTEEEFLKLIQDIYLFNFSN